MSWKTTTLLAAGLALAAACTRGEAPQAAEASPPSAPAAPGKAGDTMITEAEARAIAQRDAQKPYGSLEGFVLKAELKDGRWHLAYDPPAGRDGGGPVYVIDARSGEILSKDYYQ